MSANTETDSAPVGPEGYAQSLGNRQVQMIAIGGAIGVGLFLGAGGELATAGPALVLSYAAAGAVAFLLMRALGELVLHRPTSGAFVSYAGEFYGPRAAYISGWMYFLTWAMTGIAELTAIAVYVRYWLPDIPQWIPVLLGLLVVVLVNLTSARAFGEFEFWAATLKVTALVVFIVLGTVLVIMQADIGGTPASVTNIVDEGGLFPNGVWAAVLILNAVIFAYSGVELVGIAAGEMKDARRMVPRAVNAVIWRIAIFYVGSILLLAMLLPWQSYSADESPFVTVFAAMGYPGVGGIMNIVLLTAALSSCNSGLYSSGRILRTLAAQGQAPAFVTRMSRTHVPFGGILLTAAVYFVGVLLNMSFPGQAFAIALNMASIGILWTWGVIFASQLRYRRSIAGGPAPAFPMPGSPWTSWLGLAFLVGVFILMALDAPVGTWTVAMTPVVALALAVGWLTTRRTVQDEDRARRG